MSKVLQQFIAFLAAGAFVVAQAASAGTATAGTDPAADAASSASAAVGAYGSSGSQMSSTMGQPLSSPTSMATVDGSQTFNAQVGCPSSGAYLQVTMLPTASGDLSQIAIDQDQNFTGNYTAHYLMTGPFAGICNNGVISCDAGTFNNCNYLQWSATATSISLKPVTQDQLGACYCINNYCGNNLALNNSQTVLGNLGNGITQALHAVNPRLSVAESQFPDPTQVVFYGNQAGCGTGGSAPENYYTNGTAASMSTDGAAQASDPNSGYYMVLNSQAGGNDTANTVSCSVNRVFDVNSISKNNVVQVMNRTSGATIDCGAGCLRLQLGNAGDNYWNGGSCGLFQDSEQLQITNGQYVTSATLIQTDEDDYLQFQANGTVVWSDPATWTDPNAMESNSCETRRHATFYPGTDLSTYFQNDGALTLSNHVSVGGGGEGWSTVEVHVNEGCLVKDNYVSDGCAPVESNTACQLKDETDDGVPTIRNYVSTGLTPVPQSKDITSPCNYGTITEPYFVKQRTYVCKTGVPTTYDFNDAVQRYNSVHTTLDTTTGNYTDRTVTTQDGPATFSAANATLPAPQAPPSCTQTCETSEPQIGGNVGDQDGATQSLNNSGLPLMYSYKVCTGDGSVCPTTPGETIVTPCSCRNTFTQAASTMQTIRMSGQDTICTSP